MCFKFLVKNIDGCIGFSGKVLENFDITVMPAISPEALNSFSRSYDSTSKSFTVCIPASTIESD